MRSLLTKVKISPSVFLLAFLYFIQGLPYGFQAQFLPIYLRTKGISLTNVSLFKLLFLPWVFKVVWAPVVDMYGTKRQWLIWSIFGLLLSCVAGSCLQPDWLVCLCVVLMLLNVFASIQDIAVDGIALSLLSLEELGHGNIAQVVGYKVGSLFGGGAMMWMVNLLGWTGMFLALALVYVEAILFIYTSPRLRQFKNLKTYDHLEPSEQEALLNEETCNHLHDTDEEELHHQIKSTVTSDPDDRGQSHDQQQSRDRFISRVMKTPGTYWMLGFVLLYKLGNIVI